MIILLALGLAGAAVWSLHDTGGPLFVIAIVNAVAAVWSNGVAANYGPHEAQDIPNVVALVGMVSSVVSLGLLITGLLT